VISVLESPCCYLGSRASSPRRFFFSADLNAVNNWIIPFILFLSLALFCYYPFAGRGEMDRREKRRLWSFVKNLVWRWENIVDCSQAWKLAANFAGNPGKF